MSNRADNRNKSILVVDDDPNQRQILKKILALFKTYEAANGLEATKILSQFKIDLMTLDMIMPKQDGLETLLEVRSLYPRLKVIGISGSRERIDAAKVFKFDDIFIKPVKNSALLKSVEKLLL